MRWSPLGGPNEEDEGKPVADIEGEDDLLGTVARDAKAPYYHALFFTTLSTHI